MENEESFKRDRQIWESLGVWHDVDRVISEAIGQIPDEGYRVLSTDMAIVMQSAAFNCGWAIAKGDLATASELIKKLVAEIPGVAKDAERWIGVISG